MNQLNSKLHTTTPMNEWGFVDYETLQALGIPTTIGNFKQRCGFEELERLVLSNPHSS